MTKKSIRFYKDHEVRAVWDDEHGKWWTDIVRAINDEHDYTKGRNYWKYLKGKMAKEGVQLVSVTNHFKFEAPDGKQRATDALDAECVKTLANGRSTRIWLDLMFKRSHKKCIDWSKIDKYAYLDAMRKSVPDANPIKALLQGALTDKIDDREIFMKGIDYSYYYEQED